MCGVHPLQGGTVIESCCPHCDLRLVYTVFGVLVHEATGSVECPCGHREGS